MNSNKIRLILSSMVIVLFLYVHFTSGKTSLNNINIGLFAVIVISFIVSLFKEIGDRLKSKTKG